MSTVQLGSEGPGSDWGTGSGAMGGLDGRALARYRLSTTESTVQHTTHREKVVSTRPGWLVRSLDSQTDQIANVPVYPSSALDIEWEQILNKSHRGTAEVLHTGLPPRSISLFLARTR